VDFPRSSRAGAGSTVLAAPSRAPAPVLAQTPRDRPFWPHLGIGGPLALTSTGGGRTHLANARIAPDPDERRETLDGRHAAAPLLAFCPWSGWDAAGQGLCCVACTEASGSSRTMVRPGRRRVADQERTHHCRRRRPAIRLAAASSDDGGRPHGGRRDRAHDRAPGETGAWLADGLAPP
jgi:hypothetical protein